MDSPNGLKRSGFAHAGRCFLIGNELRSDIFCPTQFVINLDNVVVNLIASERALSDVTRAYFCNKVS